MPGMSSYILIMECYVLLLQTPRIPRSATGCLPPDSSGQYCTVIPLILKIRAPLHTGTPITGHQDCMPAAQGCYHGLRRSSI